MLGQYKEVGKKERECRKEEENQYNSKLLKTYQKAYENYQVACERYDRLSQAYYVLTKFNKEKSEATAPNTAKILKRMIEEAYKEKSVIADHARECIRHLKTPKYEM
jgi:hypothetical protein